MTQLKCDAMPLVCRPGTSLGALLPTPTTQSFLKLWSAGLWICWRPSCPDTCRSSTRSTRPTLMYAPWLWHCKKRNTVFIDWAYLRCIWYLIGLLCHCRGSQLSFQKTWTNWGKCLWLKKMDARGWTWRTCASWDLTLSTELLRYTPTSSRLMCKTSTCV